MRGFVLTQTNEFEVFVIFDVSPCDDILVIVNSYRNTSCVSVAA